MKKTASFLFAVAIMIATPFVLYSCSENDEEGHTSNNQTGTPETIVPDLNKENIPFVGEWSGWGPYRASGTSASKYGLVKGIWKFSAVAEGRSPERHGAKRSTILRPLTSARNYATLSRPKKVNSEFIQAKHTPQRQKSILTNEHPPFGARKKR